MRRQIAPVGPAGRRGEERNALEMYVPRRVDAKFKRGIEQAFAARLHFHPTLLANGFVDSSAAGRHRRQTPTPRARCSSTVV